MKKIVFSLIITILLLSACSKDKTNNMSELIPETKTSDEFVYTGAVKLGKETCGEKTCALVSYLQDLENQGKVNMEKADYFQKRFGIILDKYHNDKEVFLKQPDYQKFVDDFYKEYFPCERKIEICHNKGKYSFDDQNFFRYLFIPRMVGYEFEVKRGGNADDSESVIQSIRRKYYATYDEKKAALKVWADKAKKAVNEFKLEDIDKEKLKTDENYFNQVIMTPQSGLFDVAAANCLTPIPWPEKGQNTEARNYAIGLFFEKLEKLGISKEDLLKKIGSSQENFAKLEKKLKEIDEKYRLRDQIPSDRFLTHAEIANFYMGNLDRFNKFGIFNRDALEIKHLVLIQFLYDNEDLYNMDSRVALFNSEYNFLGENVVKYTKYMDKNFKY